MGYTGCMTIARVTPIDPAAQRIRQASFTDRDFQFVLQQYRLFADRVTELQKERENWIRHSIIATFAFLGWIGVYRDTFKMTFMLDAVQVQLIYLIPFLFNMGGAIRFFFIQRDINRHVTFLAEMERDHLCLPDEICDAPKGRGLRDRHWHAPTICYWLAIVGLSGVAAVLLIFPNSML